MADFCWDCTDRLFGPDIASEDNDLGGLCEEDEMLTALCEGCGFGHFDHQGKRITEQLEFRGSDDPRG